MLPETDWNVIPLDMGKLTIYGLFMTRWWIICFMLHAFSNYGLSPG